MDTFTVPGLHYIGSPELPPMTALDGVTQPPCMLHKAHTPPNLTVEFHHVVPVAWQLHTPLGPGVVAPSPGPDSDGRGMLWDNRGVSICPTGHRNVHAWIVQLMRMVASLGGDPDVATVYADVVKSGNLRRAEPPVARLALERLVPYGSLAALVAAHQWGQS